MPERSFPPLDDPTRYDQIVRRGRSLRRRRQVGIGAGAGGGVAAVVIAVVLMTGAGNGGADQKPVVADEPQQDTTTTTVTTTTTTTAPPPPEELVAEVELADGTITVEVVDPGIAVHDAARQCVLVSMIGPDGDTAEGYGCDDTPETEGMVMVDLRPTDGVMIGCAATLTNPPDATEHETELRATTFRAVVPEGLAPGDYDVEIGVTSGIGDGCADTGDEAAPGEPISPGLTEHSITQRLTLPVE